MGSAIRVTEAGKLVLNQSSLTSHSSAQDGGAVYATKADVHVVNSILANNFSRGDGAAIAIGHGGSLSVANSTFRSNSVENRSSCGGAIYMDGGREFTL